MINSKSTLLAEAIFIIISVVIAIVILKFIPPMFKKLINKMKPRYRMLCYKFTLAIVLIILTPVIIWLFVDDWIMCIIFISIIICPFIINRFYYKLKITLKVSTNYLMIPISNRNKKKVIKLFNQDLHNLLDNDKIKTMNMNTHTTFVSHILKELKIDNKQFKEWAKQSQDILKNDRIKEYSNNKNNINIRVEYIETDILCEKSFLYSCKQIMSENKDLLEETQKFKVTITKK